ncbi:YetF domain-containing protein [Paenibacillus sp. URB8-2]|uniref:YetF domain-containing protein n=1 Tax=Paenibacillus sp. URB8-2 TaxID=2741301 RepID=UPI001E601B2B|nr:YetF domain-containing protein [Paenibacillus sp. URB8-2]
MRCPLQTSGIRYTQDSLDQSLREKGVFNIEEAEYAVLEDNGRVSILKKSVPACN